RRAVVAGGRLDRVLRLPLQVGLHGELNVTAVDRLDALLLARRDERTPRVLLEEVGAVGAAQLRLLRLLDPGGADALGVDEPQDVARDVAVRVLALGRLLRADERDAQRLDRVPRLGEHAARDVLAA